MGTQGHRLPLAFAAAVAVALCVAGGAAAASPPAVATGAATAVGPTSASVAGTVNPNGLATRWYVEYGTSASYGSRTSFQNAGSGTGDVSVAATVGRLSPGTTYHYRVVAASSAGTTQGVDAIFATATAPAVATSAASAVSVGSATLNGTVNPNGRGTTWYFEYGTHAGYGARTPAQNAGSGTTAVTAFASVSNLRASTLYHFRLVAASDAGTSKGADQTFSTATAAPAVATAAASSVSFDRARLNGDVNANGQPTSAYFEYGPTTGYGSRTGNQSVGSGMGARNVSAPISRLTAGTTYHFRLVASSAAGTSYGNDQAFTTVAAVGVQTGPVQGLAPTTATLTGSINPNGRSTTWYFDYGTSTSYGSRTAVGSAGAGTAATPVSFPLSSLSFGTTYHYRLVGTNSAGTSVGADASFTTPRPTVTLAAHAFKVVHGRRVELSGTVSSGQAGETVNVLAQPFGQATFATVATVSTGPGGSWAYLAKPSIQTAYEANWNGVTSGAVTIGVRPALSLRFLGHGRFSTHFSAARPAAGRVVKLQRLSSRGWVTVMKKPLNRSSSTIFQTSLPQRTATLRVVMSVNQAGPGYLGAFSRTVVYRRA